MCVGRIWGTEKNNDGFGCAVLCTGFAVCKVEKVCESPAVGVEALGGGREGRFEKVC